MTGRAGRMGPVDEELGVSVCPRITKTLHSQLTGVFLGFPMRMAQLEKELTAY